MKMYSVQMKETYDRHWKWVETLRTSDAALAIGAYTELLRDHMDARIMTFQETTTNG